MLANSLLKRLDFKRVEWVVFTVVASDRASDLV